MKAFGHFIPIYKYDIVLVQISKEDIQDEEKVNNLQLYLEQYFPQTYITDTIETAKRGTEEAITRSNGSLSVCIFYNVKERKAELYGHEKRHVEDRILRLCGVKDIEAAGYLAGYLSTVFDDFDNLNEKTKDAFMDGSFDFKIKN